MDSSFAHVTPALISDPVILCESSFDANSVSFVSKNVVSCDSSALGCNSNFEHLESSSMMALESEDSDLTCDKEPMSPIRIATVSTITFPIAVSSSERIQKDTNLAMLAYLEPVADFIVNLHRCVHGDVLPNQLEKSMRVLLSSFRNADANGREMILSELTCSREAKLIPRFLVAMEMSGEATFVGAVGEFFHACLSPMVKASSRQQFLHCLVQCNAGEILFRALKNLSPTVYAKADIGIINGFQVIAKIASKDTKLAVKCRLVGGVKFIHQLLQTSSKNNGLLQALLMVLKFIAKNGTNQLVLGKDGCVSTLVTLLASVPKTHWTKIKLIVENISLLTKTKSNVIRLVRENGLFRILSILDSWEKVDRRQQVKILKVVLCTLSHLCDSRHGQKAVLGLNGGEILHRFILSCPTDPKYETLLGNALNIFLKCASKGELPVASLKGAITFQMSTKDFPCQTNSDRDQESSDEEDEQNDEEDVSFDLKAVDFSTIYRPQTAKIDDLLKMSIFFAEFRNEHLGVPYMSSKSGTGSNLHFQMSEMYLNMSSNVRTLVNFVKIAYPDMINAGGPPFLEPLYQKSPRIQREKALRTLDRILNASNYQEKVVFDLDYLLESERTHRIEASSPSSSTRNLSNWDEKRTGKIDVTVNHLNFESRFESGNLRRVIQVAQYEFDLLLNSDVNSWHHHQWFYFEVSNMEAGVPYILNIINNEKPNSEFNFGMKPVMLSVKECQLGRKYWVRAGEDICYHKNHFVRVPKQNDKIRKGSGRSYYTASLTIKFPHDYDVVYLAYHYPYTYTMLKTFLACMEVSPLEPDVYFLNQTLCHTLNGNRVPVLTITSNTKRSQEKDVVFLSARVHPGESNSSWMMEGVLRFLLGTSKEAKELRNDFIFKIVPMLNPEGVIHGNQRCGLTDEDLNRRWRFPNASHHPTIYYAKAMIEHLTAVIGKPPLIFCDFHGHSRQKNVFMYGCSRMQSWWSPDKDKSDPVDLLLLPRLCQLHMATFSLHECRLQVERAKESTARVAVWRQFGVTNSFTIEASTCGCDQGPYANHHLSPLLLLESGEGFCKALHNLKYDSRSSNRLILTAKAVEGNDEVESERVRELNSEEELDFDIYGGTTS